MTWKVGHTIKRCKKPVEDSGFGESGGGFGGGFGNETTFDSGAGATGDNNWGDNNPVEAAPPVTVGGSW